MILSWIILHRIIPATHLDKEEVLIHWKPLEYLVAFIFTIMLVISISAPEHSKEFSLWLIGGVTILSVALMILLKAPGLIIPSIILSMWSVIAIGGMLTRVTFIDQYRNTEALLASAITASILLLAGMWLRRNLLAPP